MTICTLIQHYLEVNFNTPGSTHRYLDQTGGTINIYLDMPQRTESFHLLVDMLKQLSSQRDLQFIQITRSA